MLLIHSCPKTPSVELLLQLWNQRYRPNFSSLSKLEKTAEFRRQLIDIATWDNRWKTAAKLSHRVLATKCQMASIQANELYAAIPNMVCLKDAQWLADIALLIYLKIVDIYQQPTNAPIDRLSIQPTAAEFSTSHSRELSLEDACSMPPVERLAEDLEPLLIELQQQYVDASDWRTLGFLTTLLNFCNRLILEELSRKEQILITPYLRFVEEQVAIPWQRICVAAARYSINSHKLALVKRCMPKSRAIAQRVYDRVRDRFPSYRSRSGSLSDRDIAHSSIRDIEMCQAYLWLSFLDESLLPIENELLPLCAMVYPSLGVDWDLIHSGMHLLVDEILATLNYEQATLIRPYLNGFTQALMDKQSWFNPSSASLPIKTIAIDSSAISYQMHDKNE